MDEIIIGALKGSCQGPLLSFGFINDLPCIVKETKVSMYADDTSIYMSSKYITELNRALMKNLGGSIGS